MGRRILSGSAIKKTDNETKRRRILSTANGKNHGGIADGVEYIGASALAGLGGVAEGIGDLLAAGSAAIGGNTERAKSYFKDNKVADWHEDVRTKTNPGTVSGFLGDAFKGLGQSSVFLLDAAVPGLGTGLFFTGVSSQGISDAAAKTGDVGAKEIAYGIGSGAVEAITEKLVGAGGQAASKWTKAATKGAAKTAVTKAVGNSVAKRMVWETAKGALGEGAEEFLGEYADTFLQRVTGVDKEAQYSLKDALYSAAVGAVSGGMMTGPASVHAYNSNARRGQALTESGMTDTVIRTARATQQVAQATTERFDKNREAQKAQKAQATEDGGSRIGQAVNTYKWNRKRKQTADFEEAIRDNLAAWDSLSEEKRNSKEGYALLGEIQGNLTFHEINAAIDEALEEVVSLSDEELSVLAEQVNRQLQQDGEADGTQQSYTVQDIRDDRDGIATQLAALRVIEQLAAEDGTDTGDNEMAQDAPRTAQEATEQDTGTNTQGQTPEDILTEKYGQAWPAQSERDIMNQMAEAYGMEPALREQAEADYLAYGGGMDLRRFLMSYNTEAFLGRYNLDKAPIDMGTDPLPEKARENARKMGRILEEDKIRKAERERAKSQTDGKEGAEKKERRLDDEKTDTHEAVNLDANSTLYREITVNGRTATSAVREQIIKRYGGKTITFRDGTEAFIYNGKTGQAGNEHISDLSLLVDIIKSARKDGSKTITNGVFDSITSYHAKVVADGRVHDIFMNVGHDKESGKNYLYDVTGKNPTRSEKTKRASTEETTKNYWVHDGDRVHMRGIRESGLDGNRKATVAAARVLANVMDTDIYLFMSEEVDGKRVMTVDGKQVEAPNGWIDGKGHIHIDLNAGMDGQGLGVFTLAHEATHFIRQYSPTEFDKLATFVLNRFGEKGADVDGMIRRRMADMEKRGRTQDMNEREKYDAAYEEVVADAMEPMLRDGQAISELYEVNSSLFQKLKDHILAIVEKIKKAISGLRPDSEAGRMMAEMTDCFEEVRQRFVLALSVAGEQRREAGDGTVEERFSDRTEESGNDGQKTDDNADNGYSSDTSADEELIKFYHSVLNMSNEEAGNKRKYRIGDINDSHARMVEKAIKEEIGKDMDLTGYSLWIDGNGVRHIYNRHGPNGKKDMSMKEDESISRIGWVANHATKAETVRNADGSPSMDVAYTNSDKSHSPKVKLSTPITDGTFYVIECVPDSEKRRIFVKSAYIQKTKTGSTARLAQMDPTGSLHPTPEAADGNNATMDSISQNAEKVKDSDEKTLERFSDRAETLSENGDTEAKETAERKPRKDEYATRGLLSSLIGQNLTAKADTKWISDYGNRLNELRKWQDEADKARQRLKEQSERVRELNSQIKELKDKPLDEAAKRMLIRERDAAKEAKKKAQADIDTCTGQVADADARLRRMEATETARRLIRKAQKKVDSTVSGLEEQVKRAQEMTDRTASAWDAYHRKETERQQKKYDDMLTAQLDRLERERNRNQGWRDSFERGKIKQKVVSTVKRMVDMLEHPTKERNIPQEMKPYVAELIGGLNLDTVQEEKRLSALQEKIDAELKKADPDMEQIQVWERAKENIQALGQPCTEFLRRAEMIYGRLKAAQNEDVRLAYDENVMTLIRETNENTVKGRSVNDLSLEELREVKKTVEAVVHMMSEYRNTMSTEKKERISELAGATVEEIQALKKKNAAIPSAISWLKGAYWNELKPLYAIDEIGSPTLRRLFMNLYDKSERVYVKDLDEENDFYCSMQEKYKTDTWDMEKVYTFETGSGKVDLHLQQIMSLYAASKRAQYEEHIREGGFVLSTRNEKVFIGKGGVKIPVTMEIDDSMKYRLNEMQMAKIVGTLTESQRAYVEEMVGYLSTVMASKGNEVSLKLYGTELFIEPWYFPIQTAKEYRAEPSREMGDPSLKNMGMTKQTTPGANNPVMLSDFDAVWGKHCVDMAKYHSTVLPLEDFSRVMNWAAKPGETDGYSAVKAVIKGTHGRQANEYLRKMMLDLNGGVRNDNPAGFIGKMTSLWKKSATFCSLSVVIQQPTAIFRAKAMLDGKYFATTESLKFGKDHDAQWEQLKKYSSTASIKDMGFFDTGVGMKSVDYILRTKKKTTKEKMQAMIKDPAYRDEVLSKMPAVADEYGWIHIWEAVKAETADKNPSMKVGSEEFLTVAGQRFDEIVRYTQVYDSTLSKSGFMRSKDGVVQMATAFMAEPTTSVNMIIKAIRKGLDGDKKGMANWLGGVIASMIVNSLLVSLVYAMRDDDEDQTYGEKYWESAAEQLNPLTAVPNMLPFVRDIVSVCQGYEVERTDMSVITDVVGAFKILQSTTKTKWQKFETFTGAVGTAFGLPTKNILRDSRALVQTISGSVTGEGETTTGKGLKYAVMSGLFGKTVSNGQQLYEAAMDGDSKQYGRVMSRFATEAQAKTALRTAIRSNDKRIGYAADARLSGDTATAIQIRNEIVAEGHFPEEDVLAAINAEYNSIKQKQQEES